MGWSGFVFGQVRIVEMLLDLRASGGGLGRGMLRTGVCYVR